MAPSVPVSLLLTKDVAYEWHDAVAIVAQLVAQVREDIPFAQPRIPELRALMIEETGTLTSSHGHHTVPGMPGAAQLLQQLLSGRDQPPPLRLYLMQALTAEPTPPLGAFADELLKWERPNRQPKLATLYARAVQMIGPATITEEARERVEHTPRERPTETASPIPKKVKKPKAPSDPNAPNTPMVLGVLVILAALIVGGGAWYILARPSAVAPPLLQEEADNDKPARPGRKDIALPPSPPRPATSAINPLRGRRPPAPLPAAMDDAEAELARARDLFQRQEYAAANIAFDRVIEMLENTSSPQAEEIRTAAKALAEVSRAAIAEEAEVTIQEYRNGDEGVSDPVPLAYLPPRPSPNTPPEGLQVLEVHINSGGTVDSAKFVMNRPTFRNSWWTSAAKAWRFTPATKGGRPVRFVMRIVMDDPISGR